MPLSAAKLVDRYGESVGTVAGFWLDPSTHRVAFLGVKTGWLPGRVHILPAGDVEIEEHGSLIAPGYTAALIKKAPTGHPGAELAEVEKERINAYFGRFVPVSTGKFHSGNSTGGDTQNGKFRRRVGNC